MDDLSALSNLTALTWLDISRLYYNYSEDAGIDISPLASLTELVELNAGHNRLKDINALNALTELEVLTLNSVNISSIQCTKDYKEMSCI